MSKTSDEDWRPWPWSVTSIPTSIRDLIGRKVRIVRPGDVVTQDFQSGRVTILVGEDHRITDIKIEPGDIA